MDGGTGMSANLQFTPGQKVFAIACLVHEYPCFVCDETGVITVKNHSYDCPKCQGLKEIYDYQWQILERQTIITEIVLKDNSIDYHTNRDPNDNIQIRLFPTLTEAKSEADKGNKHIMQKLRGEME
jgi:hypothetical protein